MAEGRSSADSSVVEDGFYSKISLDPIDLSDEGPLAKYDDVIGGKEEFIQSELTWFWWVVWGIADILAGGFLIGITVAATFGFILPSSELVIQSILGQPVVRIFIHATAKQQFVAILSGMLSGFVLGSTHAVVSESLAMYVGQYTGTIEFKDVRGPASSKLAMFGRFLLDVVSEDAIITAVFAGALAISSTVFFTTQVSPIVVGFCSCVFGGLLTGAILIPLQKSRKVAFDMQRREQVLRKERRSFMTIFESRIGALIRQEDLKLWVNAFVARVFAGVVFRPVAIVISSLVQSRLESINAAPRVIAAFTAFAGAGTLLFGWYFSLRLFDALMDKYGPKQTETAAAEKQVVEI